MAEKLWKPDYDEAKIMQESLYENNFIDVKEYSTSEEVLKSLFGYDSFRTGQKSVIESIMTGGDGLESACILLFSPQDIIRYGIKGTSFQTGNVRCFRRG